MVGAVVSVTFIVIVGNDRWLFWHIWYVKTYEPPEIPLELLHSQNCLTKCLGSSLKLLKF
jgi:hypothetical protein